MYAPSAKNLMRKTTRRDAKGQHQLVRRFHDVASLLARNYGDAASRGVPHKPQQITHGTAGTKHALEDALRKLPSCTSMSILHSATFTRTCTASRLRMVRSQ